MSTSSVRGCIWSPSYLKCRRIQNPNGSDGIFVEQSVYYQLDAVANALPNTGEGKPAFEFGFDGGSLALFRERIKGSGGLGKRAGFSFGATRVDVRHGIDGNDEYGHTAGAGRFAFNGTPAITISANFFGASSNARVNDSPFPLPAAFTSGPYPKAIAGQTFHPDFNNPAA